MHQSFHVDKALLDLNSWLNMVIISVLVIQILEGNKKLMWGKIK